MNVFRFKGFIGSIEADPVSKCLNGELLYINDLVTYEADTVAKLEIEFKHAVDDYLKTCKELGREPLKPFKGSLNIRIGAALHKEAALFAAIDGISLNEFIKIAIENQVRRKENM